MTKPQSRRVGCPVPDFDDTDKQGNPVYWIQLPARWKGEHADRRDEAVELARELGLGNTNATFAVCLSLLDSWNLPGLPNGQIDGDGIRELDLGVIAWVNQTVWPDYQRCFVIPKNS